MGVRSSPSLSRLLNLHSAAAALSIRNPARTFTWRPPCFSVFDVAFVASMLARSMIPCACAAASALRLASLYPSPRDLRRRPLRMQIACVATAVAASSQPESTALPVATQPLSPSSSLSDDPTASMIVQSSTSWLPPSPIVQSVGSAALALAQALDRMPKIVKADSDRSQLSTAWYAEACDSTASR